MMLFVQMLAKLEREQLMYDQMEDYSHCSLMEGS